MIIELIHYVIMWLDSFPMENGIPQNGAHVNSFNFTSLMPNCTVKHLLVHIARFMTNPPSPTQCNPTNMLPYATDPREIYKDHINFSTLKQAEKLLDKTSPNSLCLPQVSCKLNSSMPRMSPDLLDSFFWQDRNRIWFPKWGQWSSSFSITYRTISGFPWQPPRDSNSTNRRPTWRQPNNPHPWHTQKLQYLPLCAPPRQQRYSPTGNWQWHLFCHWRWWFHTWCPIQPTNSPNYTPMSSPQHNYNTTTLLFYARPPT